MPAPLLELENLQKYFPVSTGTLLRRKLGWVKAVDGVDFAVWPGETLGLIGESGCGKTTTSKLILLQETPTAGTVRFGGENISAQEVEALLATHPAVSEAACVAAPDAVMGEEVCAYVIPAGPDAPILEELRTYLAEQGLARFKLPSRLEVRADLPRTASGKVQKAPLRVELAGVEA